MVLVIQFLLWFPLVLVNLVGHWVQQDQQNQVSQSSLEILAHHLHQLVQFLLWIPLGLKFLDYQQHPEGQQAQLHQEIQMGLQGR